MWSNGIGPGSFVAIIPKTAARGDREETARIARYDFGHNSAGLTFSWTGATHSSLSNPAGALDRGAEFGRRLAVSGLRGPLVSGAARRYNPVGA
jgi:hypothetical protein